MSDHRPTITLADLEAARECAWEAHSRLNFFGNIILLAPRGRHFTKEQAHEAALFPFRPFDPVPPTWQNLRELHFGGSIVRHAGKSAMTAHQLTLDLLARLSRRIRAALALALPEEVRVEQWKLSVGDKWPYHYRFLSDADLLEEGALWAFFAPAQQLWDAAPAWEESFQAVREQCRTLPHHRSDFLNAHIDAEFIRAKGRLPVPGRDGGDGEGLALARHSPDFRQVHWYGTDYYFTETQTPAVRLLWEAWKNRTPDVGHKTLLGATKSQASRLADVFKNQPAWGSMIVDGIGSKGTKRLCAPD